jgi:beta-hydroxylase
LWFLDPRIVILAIFVVTGIYVHYRGRIRHPWYRQMFDHSSIMAPINAFAYAFSKVPTTPYLPVTDFPELAALTAQWPVIREEAVRLRENARIKAADTHNDIGFNSFFRNGWKRFYLKWYDEAHPSARQLAPKTVEILQQFPTVKAAMFAELPPGAKLGKHRDPYAGSLRYHLGLATANDPACWIDVDGERYWWKDGEATIFDETYLHWAANDTQTDRIIMFCDIERPMKYRWAQTVNRAIGGFILRAAASPNEVGDNTGGLNRAFGTLYKIRMVGKRMKAWNRTAYYTMKWSLYALIAIAVFWGPLTRLIAWAASLIA